MKIRKRLRIGILDVLLVLCLLCAIVVGLLRALDMDGMAVGNEEENHVRLFVEELPTGAIPHLHEGDLLYNAEGALFGRLASIEVLPVTVEILENGAFYRGEWDTSERCSLRLTVSVKGIHSDGVFLWEGRRAIPTGLSILLYGDLVHLNCVVMDVS